jgi:hypothetical protein
VDNGQPEAEIRPAGVRGRDVGKLG